MQNLLFNQQNRNPKTPASVKVIGIVGVATFGFLLAREQMRPVEEKRKRYFNSEIHSKIVAIRPNESGGRTYNFVTQDSNVLVLYRNSLKIGDSVIKEKKSWSYDAYRKHSKHNYYYYFTSEKVGSGDPN